MRLKAVGELLWRTVRGWREDNASLLAAGIAFYAVLSLAPLAMLAVAVGGLALGDAAAAGRLAAQLEGLVAPPVASAVEALLRAAGGSGPATATLVSAGLLLWSASNVFLQLQRALNLIWRVEGGAGAKGLWREVREHLVKRLVSFGMVLVTGLLLLLSVLLDTGLHFTHRMLVGAGGILADVALWKMLNQGASFLLLAVMTALIYQFLPDTQIRLGDVWIGAALTSLLLALGRWAAGFYFRVGIVESVYGVAGSFIVLMVGIFLSAQIFLFGAKFTWEYSRRRAGLNAGAGGAASRKAGSRAAR